MIPAPEARTTRARLLVWWILWAAILAGLVLTYLLLAPDPVKPPAGRNPLAGLVGLAPLFVSIVIRWLVLPRFSDPKPALPMFVVGLALAEACGVLGIVFGGVYRDDIFLLGVLGVVQFVPFFAGQYLEPRRPGFFPDR